jgi:hypothetical protein
MNVDVFTLCDFAETAPGNKMTIVGTFDSIAARQAPVVHPLCALAILMRFEQIEQGNKNIRVSIIDSDGRAIMPTLNAQLNVQIRPNESDASVPLALVIQQLRLPRFGEYSIDLAVDNRQEASIPLYVRQAPVPQQQPPPTAPQT